MGQCQTVVIARPVCRHCVEELLTRAQPSRRRPRPSERAVLGNQLRVQRSRSYNGREEHTRKPRRSPGMADQRRQKRQVPRPDEPYSPAGTPHDDASLEGPFQVHHPRPNHFMKGSIVIGHARHCRHQDAVRTAQRAGLIGHSSHELGSGRATPTLVQLDAQM